MKNSPYKKWKEITIQDCNQILWCDNFKLEPNQTPYELINIEDWKINWIYLCTGKKSELSFIVKWEAKNSGYKLK